MWKNWHWKKLANIANAIPFTNVISWISSFTNIFSHQNFPTYGNLLDLCKGSMYPIKEENSSVEAYSQNCSYTVCLIKFANQIYVFIIL